MILKTQAICIKNTRYGESSVISKMFSQEYGLSAFIIQGINRKSSAIKPSHIAPGNIVDLVIYQKPNAGIQRVKELRIAEPLLLVQTDMVKNAVLQFIMEIIVKTNEEQHPDDIVFNFLRKSILDLEKRTEYLGQVPLYFLCNYLKFSGWFPNLELWEEGKIFKIYEGRFELNNSAISNHALNPEQSKDLFLLLQSAIEEQAEIIYINNRREMFNTLLAYYEIHILKGKKIKSPAILAEVLY